jgi:hypothetical protein
MKNKKYARKCDACGCGMNEGYCIQNGEQYYCCETCLTKQMTKEEYLKLYDEGEGDFYWTVWEDNDL